MSEKRKLRFLQPRGYNGAIIARGALIEVSEPWASRFIADGTAIVAETVKAKASEPEAEKPKAKGKKK